MGMVIGIYYFKLRRLCEHATPGACEAIPSYWQVFLFFTTRRLLHQPKAPVRNDGIYCDFLLFVVENGRDINYILGWRFLFILQL
jgi:hypothetical protein